MLSKILNVIKTEQEMITAVVQTVLGVIVSLGFSLTADETGAKLTVSPWSHLGGQEPSHSRSPWRKPGQSRAAYRNRTDDLRITRVFSCVARGFKACPIFMFAGCRWWRSLAVDGGSGASRGHRSVMRRPGSQWDGAVERPSADQGLQGGARAALGQPPKLYRARLASAAFATFPRCRPLVADLAAHRIGDILVPDGYHDHRGDDFGQLDVGRPDRGRVAGNPEVQD